MPSRRRSGRGQRHARSCPCLHRELDQAGAVLVLVGIVLPGRFTRQVSPIPRSEEHTSELQSQSNLVCRLLLGENVHLRLSLDDAAAESFAEVAFATAEPFRVVELGCRAAGDYELLHRASPVTPECASSPEAHA